MSSQQLSPETKQALLREIHTGITTKPANQRILPEKEESFEKTIKNKFQQANESDESEKKPTITNSYLILNASKLYPQQEEERKPERPIDPSLRTAVLREIESMSTVTRPLNAVPQERERIEADPLTEHEVLLKGTKDNYKQVDPMSRMRAMTESNSL